ncbi:MAG: hypothetical protein ACQEQG_07270 [Bacillota bacterium]
MAKVTGPLFSMDARGKFGDDMVFSNWKGVNYVRRHTESTQPNTAKQQAVKKSFTEAAAMYQLLTGTDKMAWKRRASGQPVTGYNLFMKKVCSYLHDMPNFNLIRNVSAEANSFSSAIISFETDFAGPVQLAYGDKPSSYLETLEIMADPDMAAEIELINLEPDSEYFFRLSQEVQYLEVPANLMASVLGTPGSAEITYLVTALKAGRETNPVIVDIFDAPEVLDESNSVELNWYAVDGADGYKVYRQSNDGMHESGLIGILAETTLADIGQTPKFGSAPETNQAALYAGETGDYSFTL